jgi:hypothetical protein
VQRADIRTRPDNTSRGWGMLHMATPEDATAVIEVRHRLVQVWAA